MTKKNHPGPELSVSPVGQAGAEHLTTGLIWMYATPKIGINAMAILFGTYLMKFATDVLLIAPAAMGLILASSRIWDGVSDPMAGYLSDRTNSRFGRRRVWLFASAIPIGLALVMIWSPPAWLEGFQMIAWMAFALIVYETANTAFYIPHNALGVEMTPNYHERTRLFGYTHMIAAMGTVLGLGILYLLSSAEDKRSAAILMSTLTGLFVASSVILATRVLPERSDYQGRGAKNPIKSFTDVFKNPHSFLLLLVFGIETFGVASIGLLVPYIVEYVIPESSMPVSPSVFMVAVLITYTVPQFLFVPVWIWAAKHVGKKALWATSMWITTFTFGGFFFALDYPMLIWILSFTLGVSNGISAVVGPSIQADIIDYDEFMSGERKEGSYLAVWNLVRKGAGSLTALVTGLVLQFVGFEPNIEQSEDVQLALRSLFSLLPAACYFVGACLFLKFSFNEKQHGELRKQLAQRNADPGQVLPDS